MSIYRRRNEANALRDLLPSRRLRAAGRADQNRGCHARDTTGAFAGMAILARVALVVEVLVNRLDASYSRWKARDTDVGGDAV